MYYIPAGILAKANPNYVQQAAALGVTSDALEKLNWGSLFTSNLIPVTLGNMVGGIIFVGLIFWLSLKCNDKSRHDVFHYMCRFFYEPAFLYSRGGTPLFFLNSFENSRGSSYPTDRDISPIESPVLLRSSQALFILY